jgi:hypothetical protein
MEPLPDLEITADMSPITRRVNEHWNNLSQEGRRAALIRWPKIMTKLDEDEQDLQRQLQELETLRIEESNRRNLQR